MGNRDEKTAKPAPAGEVKIPEPVGQVRYFDIEYGDDVVRAAYIADQLRAYGDARAAAAVAKVPEGCLDREYVEMMHAKSRKWQGQISVNASALAELCRVYLAQLNTPEAERAEGDDETWIPPSIENTVRAAVKEWDECRSPIDAQAAMHKIANCLAHHPAPPPAGQPEGVEALAADDGPIACAELLLRMQTMGCTEIDDGSIADGLKDARVILRRLASAQRAGKEGA